MIVAEIYYDKCLYMQTLDKLNRQRPARPNQSRKCFDW